jgi:hypothetical protein
VKAVVRRWLERGVRWSWDCGFFVNDGRLRTEIVLPNPAVPPLSERLGAKVAVLTFRAPEGRVVARRLVLVPRGQSRVVDVARIRRLPPFGQVQIRYLFAAGQARGGNRSIFQWYYPGGMTLVHEKKEPVPPRDLPRGGPLRPGQGYMTVFGIPPEGPLDLYLVCLSQDRIPAVVRLRRFQGNGGADLVSAPIPVAPHGTAFVNLREVSGGGGRLLAGPIAVDAVAFALSYYYFVHNREDDTWQAQHL